MAAPNRRYAKNREQAVASAVAGLLAPAVWAPEALNLDGFARVLLKGREPAATTATSDALIGQAILSGLRWVLGERRRDGRGEQLGDLVSPITRWVLSYERPGAHAPAPTAEQTTGASERQPMRDLFGAAGDGQARERIMRAVVELSAERGYALVPTSLIVDRAGVSRATFDEHFASRQHAAIAAYELASLRALGVTLGSFQAAADWPAAIHASMWTLLELISAAPELARLAFVEMGTARRSGRERAQERLEAFAALLDPGFQLSAEQPARVVAELIAAGIWGVIEERVVHGESARLPALAPALSYFALAPFLGAGEALRVAQRPPQGAPRSR